MKLKDLLNEISTSGGASSFVGSSGNYIDQKFSGGFHPEFGDIRVELEKQVENDIKKRMYTDDVTPPSERDFIELDWNYEYDDKVPEYDKNNFINDSETNMKSVGIEIKYDKNETKNKNNFINKSKTNMETVGIEIKYDKNETKNNKNFINKSATNWKYIK